jgi:hypothetical protein
MLSPAQKLLGSRRLRAPELEEQGSLATMLDGVTDEGKLLRLAFAERMASILYRDLSVSGLLAEMEGVHRQALHEEYRRTAAQNLLLTHGVEELAGRLSGRGVPVVLLKGVALLAGTYTDVGLRPMSDADLWVRGGDWPAVVETLGECGYEADARYPHTFRRGTATLDMHTDLLGSDRVRGRAGMLAAGEGALFDSARPVSIGSQTALRLCRPDEIFYLGLHALKHNVDRLIWLVEIDDLVDKLGDSEWATLLDRARQMQQELSVYCIAYLADLMLAGRCAGRLAEAARHDQPGPRHRRMLQGRATKGSLPMHAPLLFFAARQGRGARASFILETLFPRPAVLRQIIHDGDKIGTGRLYWRRFCQLVERTIR